MKAIKNIRVSHYKPFVKSRYDSWVLVPTLTLLLSSDHDYHGHLTSVSISIEMHFLCIVWPFDIEIETKYYRPLPF